MDKKIKRTGLEKTENERERKKMRKKAKKKKAKKQKDETAINMATAKRERREKNRLV